MTAEELLRILEELGTRLEGPARYAFDLAVRWQLTGAALGVVFGAVVLTAGLVSLFFGWRVWARKSEDPFLACVTGSALSLVAACALGSSIPRLLNPEYAALLDVLDRLP